MEIWLELQFDCSINTPSSELPRSPSFPSRSRAPTPPRFAIVGSIKSRSPSLPSRSRFSNASASVAAKKLDSIDARWMNELSAMVLSINLSIPHHMRVIHSGKRATPWLVSFPRSPCFPSRSRNTNTSAFRHHRSNQDLRPRRPDLGLSTPPRSSSPSLEYMRSPSFPSRFH